ncbi:glutamine synthetase [Halogeometricum borinquense]|uniref:Glutamine synthetase n=1 Tax=Halogeometricum borinquense TaxID=60847 RepID=A0A482SXW4_9EURY|nr:glutamine synthetase family protein [Halogeometricum borinquense]RYJ08408.1 glutamine synthetase [Halogeometricum borinquense]
MMASTKEFDTIRLVWTDLNGVARGISLPASELDNAAEEGVGFANGVAELTLEPGLLDDPKYGPQHGDMMAVADLDSVTPLSWHENMAAVFTDLTTVDGKRFDLCPRSALKSVVEDVRDAGFEPFVGVETEFSLLAPDDDNGWVPFNYRCSYDMDALDQSADLMHAWSDAMNAGGYNVLGIHQESQPGQYEVNIEYDDAVTTADGVMFFRHMVKALSRNEGLKATMMPRPHSGEDANGLHYHLSLWDGDENCFAGGDDAEDLQFPAGKHPHGAGISDTARYFMGGLLEHMKALTAVCAPTVNSYKRLIPGIWAPVNIAWGPDNRSTVLRLPPELGPATRIEHRVTDSAANPYLSMAATLAAGLDGIENEIDPGEGTLSNAYEEDYENLPRTLPGALAHLENDAVLRDALGEDLVSEFVKLKRDEFDRYQNHVTDWEREEYRDEF